MEKLYFIHFALSKCEKTESLRKTSFRLTPEGWELKAGYKKFKSSTIEKCLELAEEFFKKELDQNISY